MLALLLLLLAPAPAEASRLRWLDSACRRDSCLHFAAAYGLQLTGSELLYRKAKLTPVQAWAWTAAGVLALGVLKESLIDDKWDGRDMSANVLGVAAGVGAFYVIEF